MCRSRSTSLGFGLLFRLLASLAAAVLVVLALIGLLFAIKVAVLLAGASLVGALIYCFYDIDMPTIKLPRRVPASAPMRAIAQVARARALTATERRAITAGAPAVYPFVIDIEQEAA